MKTRTHVPPKAILGLQSAGKGSWRAVRNVSIFAALVIQMGSAGKSAASPTTSPRVPVSKSAPGLATTTPAKPDANVAQPPTSINASATALSVTELAPRVRVVNAAKLTKAALQGPFPIDLAATAIDVWVMNPGDSVFGPGEIFTHSQVRLVIRYKNAGTQPLNTNGLFFKLVSGPSINWGSLSGPSGNSLVGKALAPEQADYGVLPYFGPGQLSAGTYTVTMKVDSGDTLSEGTEANNSVSATFTVKPSTLYSGKADLTAAVSVAALTNEAKCSTTRKYDLTATVQNVGTFPAYLHGNGVVKVTGPATTDYNAGFHVTMSPGQSQIVTFRAAIEPAQTQQFVFSADGWSQVDEANEANNTRTVSITAPAVDATERGDLVVYNAYFKYTPTNRLYWLEVQLKNQGSNPVTICDYGIWRTVNPPAGFSWLANAPQYPKVALPGEVFQIYSSARQQLPQGTYNITIEANSDHKVPETNYSNNTHTFTVRVPEDVQGL